jgi:hypothetical protein
MEAQLPRVSFNCRTELTRQYPVKVRNYAYRLLAMLHFEADFKWLTGYCGGDLVELSARCPSIKHLF